jgi:hypothetical protein
MESNALTLLVEDSPDGVELTQRALKRSCQHAGVAVARDGAGAPGPNSDLREPVDFDHFHDVPARLSHDWLELNEAPPARGDRVRGPS